MKTRKWNVTINKSAESWYEFRDIIRNLSRCKYAYIVHNNDTKVLESGEIVPMEEHVHIVLSFENAHHFEAIKKTFPGAHIEECKYFNMSLRYLIHIDNAEKFQYDYSDIVHNYDDNELRFLLSSDEYEKLDTQTLFEAIERGEVHNMTTACRKWGINQVNTKKNLIEKIINENHVERDTTEEKLQMQMRIKYLEKELQIYKELLYTLRKERGEENEYEQYI